MAASTEWSLAHAGLRIGAAGTMTLDAGPVERMIVPLDAPTVSIAIHDGDTLVLTGRSSVFEGPADVAYLPIDTAATITSDGRVAIAEAPADRALPPAVLRASGVAVELRGAGGASREVRNFGTPDTQGALDAVALIVCEVLTPGGNWSSFPAHKHDEDVPGHESRLEEIYWFELEPTAASALFVSEVGGAVEVRSGDVVLVPHGFHGPAVAPPGGSLYYLNVMAGPDPERAWLITDDPGQAWVRVGWAHDAIDPRLPMGRAT